MDPYLLTRIGDVTIQRVLPKPDQPKTDIDPPVQMMPANNSQPEELDLSMKNQRHTDKGEDEGGGSRTLESKPVLDSSDASEEEEEEEDAEESEMDDDEQDVPLSLVTTRRSKEDNRNNTPSVSNENTNVEGASSSFYTSEKQNEINEYDQKKPMDFESSKEHSNEESNEPDLNQGLPDNADIDENMSLSRLLQGVNQDDSFQAGTGDETDDKFQDDEEEEEERMGDAEDDYEEEGEEEDTGQDEEDQRELEEGGAVIKTEVEDQGEGDQDQESGERNREMIVIKQEMFNEEIETPGEEDNNAKRKMETVEETPEDPSTKKSKKASGESGSDTEGEDQSEKDQKSCEKKLMNLRKNIREVMDENELDEATLSAQRQEMERLQRVQEQQRIIREVNRQINLNRQSNNVISLLQGGSGASLLKVDKSAPATPSPKSSSPNTVLVKLSSGSGPPQVVNKKVLEILKSTRSAEKASTSSKATALASKLLNKPGSLTSSVSIAPVKPGLTITKLSKQGEDDRATVTKAGKTKQKGKDVVMISSSSSDEDDCIVISGGEEEEEEEEEEDPTNSGMHTNDTYNVPDDQGRVLINVGKPDNEPEVFLAPQIARIIKPHQIGGVRFLFDNVVESLDRFKTSPGFGCILAHSMGLGKTLQVVSFCDVFLRYTEGKTVLCIMPINTLQNWLAEFNMWLPVEPSTSPFAAQGDVQPRTFPLFVLNDLQKSMVQRAKVVIQWAKEGGVLLIGYELYRQLSLHKPRKKPIVRKRKINPDDDIDDEKNKHLLEEMHTALVKPGPDLVICDEGHRIKNSHASISQALKQIRSKRRVVLTGYPLQNNLVEYWCMVDFVRPNYLGSKTEFSNMFERPIQNGQCVDSTPQDVRLMRYRAHVLHSLLKGFVQRRSHSVLTNALPQKEEYVILVRMTTFQRKLYDTFMNEVVRTKAVPNPLKAFAVCCKIWNHPDVLYHFLRRRQADAEAVDLDLEETAGALVPVPGMGNPAINPVLPVKRARGRSPKGTSPKRERKVNPRKRGGTEPDSPVKNPMVAAVMPNTTSNNPQNLDTSSPVLPQPPQTDVKPLPSFPHPQQAQFPNRPAFQQYPTNNPYPSQYPPNYPGFNQPPHNEFHNPPPYNQGFPNQQGYQNNQNMYSGFGGNYYPPQDPSFSGGNYWNNPYFNDSNNPSSFPNYNDTDPNSSGFYNQDMMGSDGFNTGHRGYNSGMNMNHPGMRGMNPMQSNRMMNNPNQGMMGMNSNMSMNPMGMPMNSMNNNMNQQNYGVNSMGMNMFNQGQQNMGMNPQQGMGMNQMGPMGSFNPMSTNNQNMGSMNMPGLNQTNMTQMNQSNPMNSQTSSSGSLHTLTNTPANQSTAVSQQEAAIQNIANNLMMSSQQVENAANSSINRPNPLNSQDMHGDASLTVLGPSQNLPNSSQNLMSGVQNQTNHSNMSTNNQNQGNPGGNPNLLGDSQSQLMAPSSQSSHSIGNMISNNHTSQNMPGHLGSNSMQTLGTFNNDSQNLQPQNVFGNQSNPNNQMNFPQNSQNMQVFNQPNSQNVPNSVQNSMIRNQQPNQNMYGQQNSVPMMGGQQNMFGGNNQQMPTMMNPTQSPRMNLVSNQPNMMSGGSMSGFDQAGPQNIMNNQSAYSGNPSGLMGTSQNQGIGSNQDIPNSRNLPASVASQQIPSTVSRNQPDAQNMYGNQNTLGNLQNMLTNPTMMGSQSKSDHPNPSEPSQQSLIGMNQNINTSTQQNIPSNQGPLMNPQSGLNDPMANTNMVSNSQQNTSNPLNPLMDSQQNMFGMNTNQMNQPNFMNNQNMQGPGLGNNLMNNQSMAGTSQNVGMMNNSGGFGMYGNQDMMSGNSGMVGNQMNPNLSNNQMGSGNMMGMYNQPGMMNYPGMVMGNQMNSYGMMNQQNANNPSTQNQPYSNNMMRNPSNLMGMRNPQPSGGMNSDPMSNNFPPNQNNFGMMGSNNMMANSFNQTPNNPTPKVEPSTFPGSSENSNSRFMSEGDFMSSTNQMNQGNVSQSNFNNEFGNFGLNNEESKMWDDINSKPAVGGGIVDKVENMDQGCNIKSENDMSSQENKVKTEEESSFSQFAKPKTEGESGCEKKEGENSKMEESKLTKEASENETKEGSEESKSTTPNTTSASKSSTREDATIPYDWAVELLKDYEPGHIEASAKFALFFCILEESMFLGDRVLVFSQSLFTLNLIEEFLQRNELPGRQERWARNWNYYRLDGSTSAMEREKLINEFNSNPNIHLFLVSTRAGSLGINLVGANRVVVLDASWNPCHDTQAVCRVYRYGQRKPCFVYRLVTDNCLEKKIYDRQVNKQGMADRVVDECNPDAHLSIKEVTNLCWDNEEEKANDKDYSNCKDRYIDVVMQKMVEKYSTFLSKEPFQHESLLVDRKDKKLSQAEKRLAKRSYEMEKQQVNTRPTYGYYPGNTSGVGRGNPMMKPMASVRPMQSDMNNQLIRDATSGRPRQWIPAEVWQKQGMSAQEMTLPLDVVIPTNSPERSSIVLKAGQKVMVLKSPKGIYMQLENGKIIAIRTAFKVGGKDKKGTIKTEGTASGIKKMVVQPTRQRAPASLLPLRNNSNISIIPRGGVLGPRGPNRSMVRLLGPRSKQPVATARPYNFGEGSSHPPVTVTVTKKRVPVGGASTSTSSAQVEIRRETKQLTVTPIPHPSLKKPETSSSETPVTSADVTKLSADAANPDLASLEPAPSTAEPSGSREEVSSATEPQVEITPIKPPPSIEIRPVTPTPNVEIKPVKSSGRRKNVEEKQAKIVKSKLLAKVDKKLPFLPEILSKELSNKISIEERARMEPSLQPVVSLKNYRHLAFQNNKTINLKETKSKVKEKSSTTKVTPLPFKTSSSLSISPVSSKPPSKPIELPTSSVSIQPIKLPSSTSVNLVKPHSSFSVTPMSEAERKPSEPKEPSMSITKISEKSAKNSHTKETNPPDVPSKELAVSTKNEVPPASTTVSSSNPEIAVTESQPVPSLNLFPVNDSQQTSLPLQPSASSLPTPQITSFNPLDYSFQPQLSVGRSDFYPGFPRPPLGFPGNFFQPRKDASGKDVPNSLPQFPFDPANYLAPNPFSAAAAGTGFPGVSAPRPANPFPSPAGLVPPSPQSFDPDFSRMYSAFHRPEPQQTSSSTFPAQTPLTPSQFNPYSYHPFLMPGFPLPGTNPQPNATSNPSNPPTQ